MNFSVSPPAIEFSRPAPPDGRSNVRIATPADLSFVKHLQKRFSNQLGFLPTAAIEWYLSAGRVTLVLENQEPAGYLLGRRRLRCLPAVVPITQAAVCFDAQRRAHGVELVNAAAAAAAADGRTMLQAWCRSDLEANDFWAAVGFTAIALRRPPTSRGLPLILWRRPLSTAAFPSLLHLPTAAGHQARRTSHIRLLTAADRLRFVA